MTRACYVTGTDTGAGKTVATVALLQALRAQGLRAVGMKPVASGCVRTADGWRNEDAVQLQAASDPRLDYALVNPHALPEATAPQIAAAHAGMQLDRQRMLAAYAVLQAQADIVLVEGVGGWLAPLSDTLDQAELARAFAIEETILVVGLRLGCINHARLSERAIRGDGFRLRGWIASAVDPALEHADEYFLNLQQALQAPCLGRLPAFASEAERDAWANRWPLAW